ncbi:MAG TPA: 6,7-dimethyl-8-ribityllumazine synthase [Bacteroidia bacterium]|nr:6,7-dimethyl-8-ribityllumazine synthase [Bacteroidia bacterium]
MSSSHKNLSDYNPADFSSADSLRIGIVVSEWNKEITDVLFNGANETLLNCGVKKENIFHADVPGSFELPLGAQICYEKNKCDAVICLGCVIRGETPHFDYICEAVSKGVMDLNLKFGIPFVFGVLTCDTNEQAHERSGGRHGNKGVEVAVTALKMCNIKTK